MARVEDEGGQTYVEYALILAMVVGIVLVTWSSLGIAIQAAVTNIGNALGA